MGALVLITSFWLWLSSLDQLQRIMDILPAPIWIYMSALVLGSIGLFPAASVAYSTLATFVVPLSLFLLTVSSDFRSVLRIGRLSAIMLAAGTSGVLIGAVPAFLAIEPVLGEDSWKAIATLSGGWIGGSANTIAVQQALETPPELLGPILIVDAVIGYGWFVILLYLGTQQAFLSRLFRYDASRGLDIDEVNVRSVERKPLSLPKLAAIIGLAMAGAALATAIGHALPELGNPTIISATTWTILVVVALGVSASFTPLSRVEAYGATDIGYFLMLLGICSLGARGSLGAFLDAPAVIISMLLWLIAHVGVLALAAWIFRAPPVLLAIGSMANIGGFVTAPIVAMSYNRNLVPTALLMAAIAQVAGVYLPFALASLLRAM
ncbi:MAG: DUF819 family protein [Pseudomonadota bacterium]